MKKILETVLCFGIISLILMGTIMNLTPPFEIESKSSPKSAMLTVGDWQMNCYANYAYCRRILTVFTIVKSPSGSEPSEIIACINGINHSLSIYPWESGIDVKYGVHYVKNILNPIEGLVQVQFYAMNSTSEVSTSIITANCTYAPYLVDLNVEIFKTTQNSYEIAAKIMKFECSTPLTVKLGINSTLDVDLTYNSTRNRWIGVKDFGFDDESSGSLYLYCESGSVKSLDYIGPYSNSKGSKIPTITYQEINYTINGSKKTVTYGLHYYSWDGTTPKALNISINDVNIALKVQPWIHWYAYESVRKKYKLSPNTADCSNSGAIYGPFQYVIENGKPYNITFSATNSTGEEVSDISKNSNATEWFTFKPSLSIEWTKKEMVTENSDRKIVLEWKVKSTSSELITTVPPSNGFVSMLSPIASGYVSSLSPEGGDWTNGWIFKTNITGYNENAPFYGDMAIKVGCTAFFNIGTGINVVGISGNTTITGIVGSTGTYGVKADDWNVWEDYQIEKGCCCGTLNYTTRYIEKIIKMGRMCNADFFLIDKYYYSYDYECWVNPQDVDIEISYNPGYWGLGSSTISFINPSNYATYIGFGIDSSGSGSGLDLNWIMPKKTDMKKIQEYILNKTGLTSKEVALSGVFTKKFTFNMTYGDLSQIRTVEFDSRVVKKNDILKTKVGTCYEKESGTKWINKGKGALPKNDGSPIIDGFSWLYLLGLGIMTIGLISVIMRKKIRNI